MDHENWLERIWNFRLLGGTLKVIIGFITLLFAAFLFLGNVFIANIGIEKLQAPLFIVFTIFVIVFYANIRFFPDLVNLFVSIEKNSQKEKQKEEIPGSFLLRMWHAFLRINALFSLLLILATLFMFFIKSDSGKITILSDGIFTILSPYMWVLFFIIPVIFCIYCFQRKITKKDIKIATLIKKHLIFLTFLLSFFLINLSNGKYLSGNIFTNNQILFSQVGLILALYIGIKFLNSKILHKWKILISLSIVILILGSLNLVISLFLPIRLMYDIAGFLFGKLLALSEEIITFFNSSSFFMVSDHSETAIYVFRSKITNFLTIIPYILFVFFVAFFNWLLSDFIEIIHGIWRKNYKGSNPLSISSSIHQKVFTILKKVLMLSLLVVFLITIFVNVFGFNYRQYLHNIVGQSFLILCNLFPFKKIEIDLNIGYFTYMLKYYSILFFFFIGLLGNVYDAIVSWESSTKLLNSQNKKPKARFFALKIYTIFSYFIGVLLSLFFIFGWDIFLEKISKVIPKNIVDLNDFWIKISGIFIAMIAFFCITFYAEIARKFLSIESNLYQEESKSVLGNFFGVKFYIYTMKTYAFLGALIILILPYILIKDIPGVIFIVLLILSAGFYVVTAALPDFCSVLVHIEKHVKFNAKSPSK